MKRRKENVDLPGLSAAMIFQSGMMIQIAAGTTAIFFVWLVK